MRLTRYFEKKALLPLQVRKATYSDSILSSFIEPAEKSFIGVDNFYTDFEYKTKNNEKLAEIQIVLDAQEMHYDRSVYNFLTFASDLGGVFQILMVTGTLFVMFFSQKLFLYSVLSQIYQVDEVPSSKSQVVPKPKPSNLTKVKNIT